MEIQPQVKKSHLVFTPFQEKVLIKPVFNTCFLPAGLGEATGVTEIDFVRDVFADGDLGIGEPEPLTPGGDYFKRLHSKGPAGDALQESAAVRSA